MGHNPILGQKSAVILVFLLADPYIGTIIQTNVIFSSVMIFCTNNCPPPYLRKQPRIVHYCYSIFENVGGRGERGGTIRSLLIAFSMFYGLSSRKKIPFQNPREASSRSWIFLFSLVYVCVYLCVSRLLAKLKTIQT